MATEKKDNEGFNISNQSPGEGVTVDISGAEGIGILALDDGGAEVSLEEENPEDMLASAPHDANLAEYLSEDTLNTLASEMCEQVDTDMESRKEWMETYAQGLDVLGLKYEEMSEPWEGACGAFSPVLAEAAIRFQAETMSETFPAAGPVKTKILGTEDREKKQASERVKADMNYQITEVMEEYRPEHERMLYSLGLAGSAFKKVYFDPIKGRQVSVYIPAEDVVVPYGASDLGNAERVTHIMRKVKGELQKLQESGFYVDCELGDPEPFHTDLEEKKAKETGFTLEDDDRYALFEVHAEMHVPGLDDEEDPPKPYVFTIERGSKKVMALYRNWDEMDPYYHGQQHFVHYIYVPGFGFYGMGLIHIIGGYARAGTSLLRQLVDAGTLSNLPAGYKTRGARVLNDDTPLMPGELRDVDVSSGTLRENIVTGIFQEPSQTLSALLDKVTSEARRLAAISDMDVSDMSSQAPVGTTLAILERTLKPMAAVQSRVHYSMKQEFKLLKRIIAENAPESLESGSTYAEPRARQADYTMVDVVPVSDPNATTMAQRVVQYQAAIEMSQNAPQIYNLPQLHRQTLDVLGIKEADKIIPLDEDMTPMDPVSENMAVLVGKPVKAFIYQDHEAHIASHTAFMQDPKIAGTIGQNPQAQQIMSALHAHIAEHVGFAYRAKLEEQLGVTLPAPEEEMPEDMEVQLSRLVADAGQQLTQTHTQEAQAQEAQERAQDPEVQMRQKDLEIKEAKQKLDEAEQKHKEEMDQKEYELDRAKAAVNARMEEEKLRQSAKDKDRDRKLDLAELVMNKGVSQEQDNGGQDNGS